MFPFQKNSTINEKDIWRFMFFRENLNFISKFIFTAMVITVLTCFSAAFANTISTIEVNQTDTNNYNIIVKLDNKSTIQKISTGKDNLTFIVKSALPSESVDIVYDNTSDIKNIIVQKKNAENTQISMQGRNIENAKIYTKELSTGITKEVNSNPLSGIFVITDKKVFSVSLLVIFLLFASMFRSKPKKQYSEKEIVQRSIRKYNKKQTINSMKRRKRAASHSVPSINYSINGSFSASNANMTAPKDFIINQYQEQQKRKVG